MVPRNETSTNNTSVDWVELSDTHFQIAGHEDDHKDRLDILR